MLKNKSILITGGTGSFGKKFVETVLQQNSDFKKLIIFSRDELKQYEMQQELGRKYNLSKVRFFLGDIRDKNRLDRALQDVDIVVHAAALKQVPAAEYNPDEFIKTNVIGAQNLIEASINNKVKKLVALSTDKAAAPINLYGATKLCSDKLFIAAKNYAGTSNIEFSIVRYGNVLESRGSVIPLFKKQIAQGTLTITDESMTRFAITLEEGVQMVLWVIKNSLGGEIFVPKIPSFKILDLAKIISPKSRIKYIGIRKGEKIHEDLITASDSISTYNIGKYYVILPDVNLKTISNF
ncbi:UDP-N-acetylglucosamine 4,6-dehydratase (inverting), partial [Pelagibacteraceae bacterium]|nr:UDP-N-acetylglucosamine 4,6-dehydratase (inverting) [Pelagibacteraceae bacterium]